jgi:molecular chaperone GrpE
MTHENKQNTQNTADKNPNDSGENSVNNNEQNTENQGNEQDLELTIANLEEDNKNLNDKILRLAAEIDNINRRNKETLEKTSKYAISNFASDLVTVAENFYLASENLPNSDAEKSPAVKQFVEAMIMTKKELTKTLEKHGIQRIYPLGEKFDHHFHEAISRIPTEKDEEDGAVGQVIQAGYSISGRLIKPALVSVLNKN